MCERHICLVWCFIGFIHCVLTRFFSHNVPSFFECQRISPKLDRANCHMMRLESLVSPILLLPFTCSFLLSNEYFIRKHIGGLPFPALNFERLGRGHSWSCRPERWRGEGWKNALDDWGAWAYILAICSCIWRLCLHVSWFFHVSFCLFPAYALILHTLCLICARCRSCYVCLLQ